MPDHKPIVLKADIKIVNKQFNKVLLPNRKLAEKISISSLLNSEDTLSWIKQQQSLFKSMKNRSLKRIKKSDYNRVLLDKLVENQNVAIIDIINEYWNELLLENEKLRFSQESSRAFQQISRIFKYKPAGKDGGIVNCIIEDSVIISDPPTVNKKLINVLKTMQIDEISQTNFLFPNLPSLSKGESNLLVQKMAKNKAFAFDLISDIIFSTPYKEKTSNLIRNLWTNDTLNSLEDIHFQARLIPLNKKHSDTPKAD